MIAERRRAWERPILILIAVAAVAVMVMAFRFEQRLVNQRLLFYQLQSMRKSVDLFKAMEKRNPESLQELARAEFAFPGEERRHRYLESPAMSDRGAFLDPFGHPYAYDLKRGWVKSTTKGYEYW